MQQAICEIVPVQKMIGIKTVNKAIGTIRMCLLLKIKLNMKFQLVVFDDQIVIKLFANLF